MFYITRKKQPWAVSLKIIENVLENLYGGCISCKLENFQPLRIVLQHKRFPSTFSKFNVIMSVQFGTTRFDIYVILYYETHPTWFR